MISRRKIIGVMDLKIVWRVTLICMVKTEIALNGSVTDLATKLGWLKVREWSGGGIGGGSVRRTSATMTARVLQFEP